MPEEFEVSERPPERYRLEVPADATMGDVIQMINDLKVTFLTMEGEPALFRQFGPSAVYFRRMKDEGT